MSDTLVFSRLAYPSLIGTDSGVSRREEEATAKGRAAGYAAGVREAALETAALRDAYAADAHAAIAAATARADRAVTTMTAATAAIEARQIALRTEAQETLLETALSLAEAIIGYEIRTNEASTVVAALTRALTVVDPADVVAVRLNPADLEALDADASTQLGVNLVADATLARGDAQADLSAGFIDAALGTALARARNALLGGAS